MKYKYNVEAAFWKIDKIIYRNNTKIIFNEGKNRCGIVIMLNPGKCIAKNKDDIIKIPKIFHSEIPPLLTKDST